MNGLDGWALALSLVGLVVGAAAWALGSHGQNYQQSFVGRRAVLISGLGGAADRGRTGHRQLLLQHRTGRALRWPPSGASRSFPALSVRPPPCRLGAAGLGPACQVGLGGHRRGRRSAASQRGRVRCRQRAQRARQLGLRRGHLAARPDRRGDRGHHHDRPRRLVVHRPLPDHGGAGRRGHRAPAPARDHAVHLPAERLDAAPVGAGQRPPGHPADGGGRQAGPARPGGHRRHERRRVPGRRARHRPLPVLGHRWPVRRLGRRPTGGPRLRRSSSAAWPSCSAR